MSDMPMLDRGRFTIAQRRRAEALILVKTLWPVLDAVTTLRMADWLVHGAASSTRVVPLQRTGSD